MPDALFVGGGTGGGKTTLARALAARHGLRLFNVDSFWYEHLERSGEVAPMPDVQWLEWSPSTQAADFERISRLMLSYVLDDVIALPEQPVVVVEGPQILPDMLPTDANAVFLIPTPEFQHSILSARAMPSSDPGRALAARLIKDRLYADRVAELARERGFVVVNVDGIRPAEAICTQVESEFRDLLSTNKPRDLTVVRQWENENMLRNLRSWVASGDTRGRPEIAFPLACECGRVGCGMRVELTLAQAATADTILAPGHTIADA